MKKEITVTFTEEEITSLLSEYVNVIDKVYIPCNNSLFKQNALNKLKRAYYEN